MVPRCCTCGASKISIPKLCSPGEHGSGHLACLRYLSFLFDCSCMLCSFGCQPSTAWKCCSHCQFFPLLHFEERHRFILNRTRCLLVAMKHDDESRLGAWQVLSNRVMHHANLPRQNIFKICQSRIFWGKTPIWFAPKSSWKSPQTWWPAWVACWDYVTISLTIAVQTI